MNYTFKLKKITIDHYKGVNHGTLDIIEYQRKKGIDSSGITALFGENGSGKSTICESLELLTRIVDESDMFMINDEKRKEIACKMHSDYPTANFSYSFDVYNRDKLVNSLTYVITLQKELSDIEHIEEQPLENELYIWHSQEYCANLVKETFIASGLFENKSIKQQEILCVDYKDKAIYPIRKQKYYINNKNDAELLFSQSNKYGTATSILRDSNFNLLNINNNKNDYIILIDEFRKYIIEKVILSAPFGKRNNSLLNKNERPNPKNLSECVNYSLYKRFNEENSNIIFFTDKESYKTFMLNLNKTNKIIPLIIPGISFNIESQDSYKDVLEPNVIKCKLSITKDGRSYPLQHESTGTKKIVSLISSYISAYEDPSLLFVVDEFDFGLHEYLIQILLEVFKNSGKGQLLFTSHNLRPLEILDKESIVFTTIDPNNRFYRFNNIREKNNLRDCYYDEISNSSNFKRKKQEQILFNKIDVNTIIRVLNNE